MFRRFAPTLGLSGLATGVMLDAVDRIAPNFVTTVVPRTWIVGSALGGAGLILLASIVSAVGEWFKGEGKKEAA